MTENYRFTSAEGFAGAHELGCCGGAINLPKDCGKVPYGAGHDAVGRPSRIGNRGSYAACQPSFNHAAAMTGIGGMTGVPSVLAINPAGSGFVTSP